MVGTGADFPLGINGVLRSAATLRRDQPESLFVFELGQSRNDDCFLFAGVESRRHGIRSCVYLNIDDASVHVNLKIDEFCKFKN